MIAHESICASCRERRRLASCQERAALLEAITIALAVLLVLLA